jgi:hypothetical protein
VHDTVHTTDTHDDPVATAAAMLRATRDGSDATPAAGVLASWPVDALADALDDDLARVAFWSNVYNAATQRALRDDPDRYAHRRRFFSADLVTVAGRALSLDDIEHCIVRRGYHKWSLGYLRWPFRSDYAERLSPTDREPRVHFALNCGAESCPVIRPYSRGDVDAKLDRATRTYLDATVEYDPDADRVALPKVFRWFRGDFGGRSGILAFLRRFEQLPADAAPGFRYREWDWSLARGRFAGEA